MKILIGLLLVLGISAEAQDLRNVIRPYKAEITAQGRQANGMVAEHRLKVDMPHGARFHFTRKAIGTGVAVAIYSNQRRKPLVLNDQRLKDLNYSTPVMNGTQFVFRVFTKQGRQFSGLGFRAIETPRMVRSRSICGTDDREPSNAKPFGRMMRAVNGGGGCSATMISESCMISAGHCSSTLNVAQFNVPASKSNGQVNHPSEEHQYVFEKSYGSLDNGIGQDWAVYSMKPNAFTRLLPGAAQGAMDIAAGPANIGSAITITGYGVDRKNGVKNQTQQSAIGKIVGIQGSALQYVIDTEPGNSGSSVVNAQTNEVIGIHTHGGCTKNNTGANRGTALHMVPALKQAIVACLRDDARRGRNIGRNARKVRN